MTSSWDRAAPGFRGSSGRDLPGACWRQVRAWRPRRARLASPCANRSLRRLLVLMPRAAALERAVVAAFGGCLAHHPGDAALRQLRDALSLAVVERQDASRSQVEPVAGRK